MARLLCCTIFRTTSFRKSFKFFETSIASLDPETVQLLVFSILSAMFTGACGLPENLSLTLVPYSNVLCMIVKLANTFKCRTSLITGDSCTDMFIYFSQLIVFIGKVHSNWNFLGQKVNLKLLPVLVDQKSQNIYEATSHSWDVPSQGGYLCQVSAYRMFFMKNKVIIVGVEVL